MRRLFLPIFWKFVVAIVLVVAVFGSINLFLIQRDVSISLERESEKRVRYIGRSLARQAVNWLLYDDVIALQALLENVQRIDSTIAYAFIQNRNGELMVHTFEHGFPRELLDVNVPGPNHEESMRLIKSGAGDGDLIKDVAIPILRGKLGTVRVGLHEDAISRGVRNTVRVFLAMVFLFLVVGLIGALAFAHYITRPVKIIMGVAQELSLDALKERSQPRIRIREQFLWLLPVRVEDEFDSLALRFNEMITRLEEAYAELLTAQKNLSRSEKLASVGTLAAGIAHEINNPIAGLQSCIRRINRDPENTAQNRRYLMIMVEAVDKIERVIRGLLDYTRNREQVFEAVDCRDVLEKSLVLVSYNLEKVRVSIRQEIPSSLPPVLGDATQLQQVFLNLLINSIHAIEERRLKVPDAVGEIIIVARIKDQDLSISVADTGVGIATEVAPNIFDPFFTTKDVGRGTGLGLSVCRTIVESHGGKIEVESTIRKGTVATVTLPIYVRDVGEVAPTTSRRRDNPS
jgi:two-component system NtrC family sensor kinase